MIQHVSFEKTTFNELPFKFEAGTPDYIGTTGLAKALDYVSLVGMDKIAAYEHELTRYAMQRLKEIPGMRIFGEAEDKGSVISFLVGDIHHFDMGTLLDRLGIAVRLGHHCAQPLMQRLGIEGNGTVCIFRALQYPGGDRCAGGRYSSCQPDVLTKAKLCNLSFIPCV